jgi:hypothetical protein
MQIGKLKPHTRARQQEIQSKFIPFTIESRAEPLSNPRLKIASTSSENSWT